MATLELVPKIPVLIVQTGVFLANIVVVKQLFVAPFLKMKDRRDALTIGNQEVAVKILAECETLTKDISSKLDVAYTEAAAARENIRATALVKKTGIIKAAEAEARSYIESIEKEINQEVANEKQKIPAIVNSLTQEFYQRTLS